MLMVWTFKAQEEAKLVYNTGNKDMITFGERMVG
jgi:hypothetical protein